MSNSKTRNQQEARFVSLWLGCDLLSWCRLIVPNWRQVYRSRWDLLLASCFAAGVNSLLGVVQGIVFGLHLRRLKPVRGPLFIIGHWRSGTTVLHHLLSLDQRHTFASNYVCFTPHHFLLTEWLLRDEFDLLAPITRPMDDLPLKSEGPQEDEFALMCLGAPSPYDALAFPKGGFDLATRIRREQGEHRSAQRWRRKMNWLVRALTFRERKRIVLKSPTHTFRVSRLLEMYPDAQFVHITRDPLVTIASTLAMWKSLCQSQSIGPLDDLHLEDCVIDSYQEMQRSLESVRRELGSTQLYEMRYEKLLEDPLGEMMSLYDALELGVFDLANAGVLRQLQSIKIHRPQVHPVSERLRSRVLSAGVPAEGGTQ